jgi:hypothetical protein
MSVLHRRHKKIHPPVEQHADGRVLIRAPIGLGVRQQALDVGLGVLRRRLVPPRRYACRPATGPWRSRLRESNLNSHVLRVSQPSAV